MARLDGVEQRRETRLSFAKDTNIGVASARFGALTPQHAGFEAQLAFFACSECALTDRVPRIGRGTDFRSPLWRGTFFLGHLLLGTEGKPTFTTNTIEQALDQLESTARGIREVLKRGNEPAPYVTEVVIVIEEAGVAQAGRFSVQSGVLLENGVERLVEGVRVLIRFGADIP